MVYEIGRRRKQTSFAANPVLNGARTVIPKPSARILQGDMCGMFGR